MTWTCPVPYFGSLRHSTLATLGINPSNREFVDGTGEELDGDRRRFPTLGSLGLRTWADASSLDVTAIVSACDDYFSGNPYSRWFDTLDAVVRATGVSYYSAENPAAHVDLVPYATHVKWGALRQDHRRALLHSGRDLVASLLRDSTVDLLVLNGASVVRQFEEVAGVVLTRERKPAWDLPRRGSDRVRGVAYTGSVGHIGDVDLGRSITVAGFNHNLQSSFGVTKRATEAIARWVATRR
jgi:hypothetical protein